MKEAIFSGEHIYKSINKKIEELNQYDVALRELEDRGTKYAPYVLLEKQRNEIKKQLDEMYVREWKRS